MAYMDPKLVELAQAGDLAARVKAIPYWYHKIELPGGIMTPGWAPLDPARYCIPDDLSGKRVLDIGTWDGYWTWEALKRGAAEVVAIDDFSDTLDQGVKRNGWKTFDLCREAFGFRLDLGIPSNECDDGWWQNEARQNVRRLERSVYDLSEDLGQFDVVFFFGTMHHLKHPLLALEKVSAVCRGAIYIETASLDDYSPYRGGLGQGFDRNEMVMEFYPGAEYAKNPSNWWVSTLQCLGAMMASVGFRDIEAWPLTETPKTLSQCRGFASGTKEPEKEPANRPADVATHVEIRSTRVAAVMSVPRLGFQDQTTCAFKTFPSMRIPLINVQGAFWGQCLERAMQKVIDAGVDIVLTLDYDTAFTRADVEYLLRLMHLYPEATSIVPIQLRRGNLQALMTMKTISGQPRKEVPLIKLKAETVKIATGHFGLTAHRVKDLLDIPHPWFHDQPNQDGQWGQGRIDADMWFWKRLEQYGKTVFLAPRDVVGHLELMIVWPDENFNPIYQRPSDFHEHGKPPNVWK